MEFCYFCGKITEYYDEKREMWLCKQCERASESAEEKGETLHYEPAKKWKSELSCPGCLSLASPMHFELREKLETAMDSLGFVPDQKKVILKYEIVPGVIVERYVWRKYHSYEPWYWTYRHIEQYPTGIRYDKALDELARLITGELDKLFPDYVWNWKWDASSQDYIRTKRD